MAQKEEIDVKLFVNTDAKSTVNSEWKCSVIFSIGHDSLRSDWAQSGNVSRLNMTSPQEFTATIVTTIQITFMIDPTAIISEVRIPEAENTIAFGGVATGSMNAKLQVMVAGIMKQSGLMLVALASSARTGRRILAVATLLVTSVTMAVITQMIKTTAPCGSESRTESCIPIQSDKPEA